MRKYFAFFHMRLLSGLQYRTAAFAGMATQAVWGILEVMLYRAFYLTAPELLPMDMQALSNYIWMQQALFGLWNVYAWEQELFQSVQSGEIAYELVRPTDIYGMWFARGVGLRLSRCALRILPVLILGILMPAPYGLRLTISPAVFLTFLCSTGLTLWLCVAFGMVCYALTFYVVDPKGTIAFVPAVCELLSGDLLPLPFFPEKLRAFAELSPFGSLQNVPLRIFGGDISGAQIPGAVLLQLFWCVVITAVGYALMCRGLRRLCIAGG